MRLLPLVYVVIFILAALVLRSFLVWRRTGINPYVLSMADDAHGYVGKLFRWTMIVCLTISLIYALSDGIYQWLTPIRWLELDAVRVIGWALLLAAFGWIVLAQTQMGASWRVGIDSEHNTVLVTTGLFAHSRNPIFLGIWVMLIGWVLVLPNAASVAVAVLGVALTNIQIRLEEEHLSRLHGDAYGEYRRRVRRWL